MRPFTGQDPEVVIKCDHAASRTGDPLRSRTRVAWFESYANFTSKSPECPCAEPLHANLRPSKSTAYTRGTPSQLRPQKVPERGRNRKHWAGCQFDRTSRFTARRYSVACYSKARYNRAHYGGTLNSRACYNRKTLQYRGATL